MAEVIAFCFYFNKFSKMSETLSCIVVDDEPIGRRIIEDFVKTIPFLELKASYEDPIQALFFLQSNEIHLVFSDIEMPKMNGIDLVKTLTKAPDFIFITAHRDFALEGFENGVIDYLVKPVAYTRFLKAVNRAKERIQSLPQEEVNPIKQAELPQNIFIKANGKLVNIILHDILYVEALGDYLKIVTLEETHTTLSTMKSMEEILIVPIFFRVHRSFIVKLNSIKSLSGNVIELINGKSITISLNKKDELFSLLKI